MSTYEWIVAAVAVAVVALLVLIVAARLTAARRRSRLQDRFGPEYGRTLENAESRREAMGDLEDRERRHAELELTPLSAAARERFLAEWQSVQKRFVDDPEQAARHAENIVRRVMGERGYPSDADWADRAEVVSVDHPDVIQRYRHGCSTLDSQPRKSDDRTESLRMAMVDFRDVFETLLEEPELAAATP